MRYSSRMRRRIALISTAVGALPCLAFAQTTYTWNGGSGDWNTATNWTPNAVPSGFANVDITSTLGLNQTITYDYTGPAVTLSTFILDNTGGGSAIFAMTSSGLALDSNFLYVGYSGVGLWTQNVGSDVSSQLAVGYNHGAVGNYALSGGTLAITTNSANENVGYSGTGSFNQTGGANSCGTLTLGANSGGTGSYALSSGSLVAGIENIGLSGFGLFTQAGGSNTVGTLTLGDTKGTYALQAGTLSVGLLNYYSGGTFTNTGGTFSATTFNQFGGTLAFGAANSPFPNPLTIGTGGNVTSFILGSGSELLTGSTVNLNTAGSFTKIGGNISATLFNQTGGTAYFPSLTLGQGNLGNYTLSGGTLTSPTITITTGTFTISGGSLNCGTFTLNSGAVSVPSIVLDTGNAVPVVSYPTGISAPAYSLNTSQGTLVTTSLYLAFNTSSASYGQGQMIDTTNLYDAYKAGSTATYTLSSTLSAVQTEYIGYQGTGVFTQTQGVNTARAIACSRLITESCACAFARLTVAFLSGREASLV
jgi:hypothetical protein